jgi:GntR family transcriptional repressor for pyruvate dehydrogenase complex
MEQYAIDRFHCGSTDSLYLQVVEKMRQMIRDGVFAEGAKLPSERELAQIFGVSRVPVREAMKILEFLGVVQNVKGMGAFIKPMILDKALDNFGFLIADPFHALMDLFEVREALEIQAVTAAATRRTDEDLLEMEEPILELERNVQIGRESSRSSLRFHDAVVRAAKNDVLTRVYDYLSSLLQYSRRFSMADMGHCTEIVDYHRRIFECIKQRDPAGAARAMKEHLESAKRTIKKNAEETVV